MIISHKLKVIFIKTKKVAGTSFEIALSKYCGESDIITPISDEDELIRKDMGYKCAQNYNNPKWNTPNFSFLKSKFYNHIDAKSIKNLVPHDIWDNYLKISFSRDPCEVVISRYFYESGGGIPFEDYIYKYSSLSENYDITHINGINVIDYIIKYENLQQDISLLEKKINTPGLYQTFTRMNAKGNHRPPDATVDAMFTDELKEYVQKKARLSAG